MALYNLYRYLPYESPDTVWQDEVARVDADFILIGHTHQQFVKPVGQKTFVNPGSPGAAKRSGAGRLLRYLGGWPGKA